MDKTLARIRQITEELYLVRDELNKRAATQSAELSSALFDSQASNELVAFKLPSIATQMPGRDFERYRPILRVSVVVALVARTIAFPEITNAIATVPYK